MTPILQRWAKYVSRTDGCWEWTGAKTSGYGVIQRGGRGAGILRAHRVSYEAFVGSIPEGFDLMHLCHNRACVNPDHLQPGTRAQNMEMSSRAGRLHRPGTGLKGSLNGNSKLTEEHAQAILLDPRSGVTVAQSYGVSRTTVSQIRLGRTWPHLVRPHN